MENGNVTQFCCEEFAAEAIAHKAFVGGGVLYPEDIRSSGQVEQNSDGTWSVNGCCGGGCHVLSNLRYCPWCGTRTPNSAA